MSSNIEVLEAIVASRLATEKSITPDFIRRIINQFRSIDDYYVDDVVAEKLARVFESRLSVTMTIGAVLEERDYEPWLETAKTTLDPYYWERYKKLLTEKQYSPHVISSLDEVTDRILGLLENPSKEGAWDRRGMVVGHVQSGKTSNYIGLIAKAADAGYRVIVVIAGIHNNLRNQTQLRIDEGFVGRDSSRLLSKKEDKYIGVGKYDKTRRPVTFTNSKTDFNKKLATGLGIPLQTLKDPAVFVIKKNSTTLKNLLEWLREHSASGQEKIDLPMLLIDDEADNASINISQSKEAVSRINGQIRSLLNMFERSCYVGYTATPFANIFIDPDTDDEMLHHDLFPRNFIMSLDPPSNYFGAVRVFLDEPDGIVRIIDDAESWLPGKHKITAEVNEIPDSLLKAIRTFVLAKAIRLARGHANQHHSMLVNVSRFTGVQKQVRNEIHRSIDQILSSIRVYGALPPENALQNPEISALHQTWMSEFSHLEFEWPCLQALLLESVAPIKVVEVNSNSSGALNYSDYSEGLSVIAIGGFALSRGLTLEGLVVSYISRNSIMYDTLLQMGRWFGYRPDYDDLCRVWMTEEAQGWYEHITESVEDLRSQLRKMAAADETPSDFGLKVRSHPDTLVVTARNKMRATEEVIVKVGLGGTFPETTTLRADAESKQANYLAAQRLASKLLDQGYPRSRRLTTPIGELFTGVSVDAVLNFLSDFRHHPGSTLTDPDLIKPYISDRHDGELAAWDVFFPSVSQTSNPDVLVDQSLGFHIYLQRRDGKERDTKPKSLQFAKQRISSRGIEKVGLEDHVIKAVETDYINDPENRVRLRQQGSTEKKPNFPDKIYRRVRKHPLLVVHLLAIGEVGVDLFLKNPIPTVAWSISFPEPVNSEEPVTYVVNTIWMHENYGQDLEEDEMRGDDV